TTKHPPRQTHNGTTAYINNQTTHSQQNIIKAIVTEYITHAFQHAQFRATLRCLSSKVTAAVLQITTGHKGLLRLIKQQRLMLDSLHLFDFF
ncbi:hypothetical protein ACTHUE_20320, partial [Neisseria sp. P0021.S005]|uniref:hypothetical protein n=1 Tax=Neisseria sp. P0021.S005 TaxID=3436820 RepID=UPI003F808E54